MNRRDLFRGVFGASMALVLPPSVADAAEEVGKRYWSLGGMPGRDPRIIAMWDQDFIVTERFDTDMQWRKEWANWRTIAIVNGEVVIREAYNVLYAPVLRDEA